MILIENEESQSELPLKKWLDFGGNICIGFKFMKKETTFSLLKMIGNEERENVSHKMEEMPAFICLGFPSGLRREGSTPTWWTLKAQCQSKIAWLTPNLVSLVWLLLPFFFFFFSSFAR